MSIPTFTKVSHISFSAIDAEASGQWWREVLGMQDLERVKGEGWFGVLLVHPGSGTVLEFQQHDTNAGEGFDPVRTGFDHLGFLVGARADLDSWQAHFARLGVTHTPTVDREYGSVLTFKDPDGIQAEMFYRENHP